MRLEAWQRNLAALWVAQALSNVAFSFIFPFMPLYVQTLGAKGITQAAQWSGGIDAAAAISMSIAQPFWGNLADRFGRKPMVIRSMVSASVIVTLMGFAASPAQLLVMRLIQGSVSGVIAASTALVATSTPKEHLGFALGIMQVATFLGASVGPLIGGLLADRLGFRPAFYSAGALLMLGGIIAIVFVRERFVRPQANAPRRGVIGDARSLLAISLFPILIGVAFLIQLAGVIISPVLTLFIAQLSGGSDPATAAGTVLAASGAVSAVSAIVVGRIGDRVSHRKMLRVCLIGAALACFPQAFVQYTWQLLGLRMLLGVFLGGLMPSANSLVAAIVPSERRGAAFGLTATASSLANAVGPLSGAAIATIWGLRTVFPMTGILFVLAVVWQTIGFRQRAKGEASPTDASA